MPKIELFIFLLCMTAMIHVRTMEIQPSSLYILTDDIITCIAATCNSVERNTLMKVSRTLHYLASKQNKDILYKNPLNLSRKDAQYYLVTSCLKGKYHVTKNLLGNGVNPNILDILLAPLLCIIEKTTHTNIVNLLREHDAHTTTLKHLPSPLILAIYTGDIEYVKKHYAEENEDNFIFLTHDTPLHIAAYNGHVDIIKFLLACNEIQINLQNTLKKTVLHYAVYTGNINIIELLLTHRDINLNEKDHKGLTPLQLAVINGSLEITKLLLAQKNIDAQTKDHEERSLLHRATIEGYLPMVKLLLTYDNIPVDAQDNIGWTPIHYAAAYNHLDIMKQLLACCAVDINKPNEDNYTALHMAIKNSALKIVKLLLADPAIQINTPENINGFTPFLRAALNGDIDIAKLLLSHDSSQIHTKDNTGHNALHCAAHGGWDHFITYLFTDTNIDVNAKNYTDSTALHIATKNKHVNVIKMLLKYPHIYVNAKNKDAETALHIAAKIECSEIMKALLRHPKIQVNEKNIDKETPLLNAIRVGCLQSVILLLQHKNTQIIHEKNLGFNLLHFAACSGHAHIIDFLCTHRPIDIDEKTIQGGMTPLHITAQCGYTQATRTVLAHGADIHAEDRNKHTPIWLVNDRLHNGEALGFNPEKNQYMFRELRHDELIDYQEVKALLLMTGAEI